MKKNILVLCTGNSCRSQIAHAYLHQFGSDKFNIYSAGVETHGLNPKAIAILKEDGIDISHHTSNHIDEYQDVPFDYILTVCDHAKEVCPYFPSDAKLFHHDFMDPSKQHGTEAEIHQAFLNCREEIKGYCRDFLLKIADE